MPNDERNPKPEIRKTELYRGWFISTFVVKKFPGFRLTAQLKTILYPAVRNLSIAARRKAGRFESDANETGTIEAVAGVLSLKTGSRAKSGSCRRGHRCADSNCSRTPAALGRQYSS